jgi:diadenosine tetraphosphate (Ap4A) HIT family hydrolase
MDDCFACRNNVPSETRPVTEAIHVGDGWRVAHAFDTSLPGWLVLVPLRHVAAVEELTADEAAAMGSLVRRCAGALRRLTGCTKSYFMFFAEAEGFAHLHVHVVPRMDWFRPEQTGPRVFSLLGLDPEHALPQEERASFSMSMQAALSDEG